MIVSLIRDFKNDEKLDANASNSQLAADRTLAANISENPLQVT